MHMPPQLQADLALANLERLRGEEGVPPRHVWYGDPHLDVPSARHEAEVRAALCCAAVCSGHGGRAGMEGQLFVDHCTGAPSALWLCLIKTR